MTTLLRFWIVVTISHVVEETMGQRCPSERSISGWMLQRHVYKTMLADIGLHCLLSCGTDDRCQSFNFVMSSHMCEFSDRTKEATPEDFIRDPDRFYFGKRVNRVSLGSIPELAAKSCKEIKMSEVEATSGKYWLSSIRPGIPSFAFCNMTTEDIDECTASPPVCHVSAQCNNTLGSYRCICDPGFTYNGKRCTDIDECTALPSACHVNAQCNNTIASYRCACNPGYAGNGKTCTDIDECTTSPSPCHVNAQCNNTIGSYRCACNLGYTGNGKTCTDINECSFSPSACHVNAHCNNTIGSYRCACNLGYTGNGKTCTDINECSSLPSACHVNAQCNNTIGSYRCACNPGYTGNGKTCTDVDECTLSTPFCAIHSSCINTLGSFRCECKAIGESCQEILCDGQRANRALSDGLYTLSINSTSFQVYCDMTTSDQSWTLIGRFSNTDAKNWMIDSGEWWYDKNVGVGYTTNPSVNTDMLSPAFWLVRGREFKITRSDDPQHTPLLRTTGNCLGGQTFRQKMESYGNFRSGAVWASDECQGNCNVQYGGQFLTTDGFGQATCNGSIQNATQVGFWCDWNGGDGAVLMIGGGGSSCHRADHGIAITEANQASFREIGEGEHDFGNEGGAGQANSKAYSLNLWIN